MTSTRLPIPVPPKVSDWLRVPDHITISRASSVAIDSKGGIYLGHRGDHPILVFGPDGTFQRSIGDELIPWRHGVVYQPAAGESAVVEFVDTGDAPDVGRAMVSRSSTRFLHGMHVDADDCLWVTDVGTHVVHRLSPEGDLLLTLGTVDEPGLGQHQFNQPTDVALNRKGEVFVTDGYVNSRVVKFTPDGAFLRTWGGRGNGPGEFNTPHAVTVGPDGLVYVSDRTNFRIQRFNDDGAYIDEWTDLDILGPGDGEINDLAWGPDGLLYLGNGRGHRVTVLDDRGRCVGSWGGPDLFRVIHGICFDLDGGLCIAEVKGHRAQKFAQGRVTS